MMDRHEPDEDDVAAALRELPREMTPPSRVAAALSRSVSRRRSTITAWRVAVAASLAVAAFAAGRLTAPAPHAAPAGQEYALLLYGGPTGGGDDRAAEYGAWARDLARAGRAVSGERLADAAYVAGAPTAPSTPLRGFFIIEAQSANEALALARQHPHARDGTVVVRPIDTPN
jgi:hypothetical protein